MICLDLVTNKRVVLDRYHACVIERMEIRCKVANVSDLLCHKRSLQVDGVVPIKWLAFLETVSDMTTRPQNHEFVGRQGAHVFKFKLAKVIREILQMT